MIVWHGIGSILDITNKLSIMADITTIGDLKKAIANLPDDFSIEFRVRRRLTDEELKERRYPYPFDTTYIEGIDFDDIGWSDKEACFGVTLPQE